MLKRAVLSCLLVGCYLIPSKASCPIRTLLPDPKFQRGYTGKYTNGAYGYSLVIPPGLTGADTENPDYQKGFTIVLRNPGRTISVFAERNSLEYSDPKSAAAGELAVVKNGISRFRDEQIVPTELAGRPAVTLLSHYRCSDQDPEYALIQVIALSADAQYIYTIEWDGAAVNEKLDSQLIAALKRSWRFFPAK